VFVVSTTAAGRRDRRDIFLRRPKKMYGANVTKPTEVRRCGEVLNCKRSSSGVVALPADRVIVGMNRKR
jgi:hypothetical protein